MATDAPNVIEAFLLRTTESGETPSLALFVEQEKLYVVDTTPSIASPDIRSLWKSRFGRVVKKLGIQAKNLEPDWKQLHMAVEERAKNAVDVLEVTSVSSIRSSSTASSSSCSTASLCSTDMRWVEASYNQLTADQHWWISSCGERISVEVQMLKRALATKQHSPVHSMILDPMDPAWVAEKYFTSAQMEIIRKDKATELPEIPAELWKYLGSYIGKHDLDSLLSHRQESNFHPLDQSDLYWAHKSIVDSMDLLLYDSLSDTITSENDLFHDVWGFIKTSFAKSNINVNTGEKTMTSTAQRHNQGRVGGNEEVKRKAMGTKVDIRFSYLQHEYGCVEAGLEDDQTGSKTLEEGRLNLPRTLKDIFVQLAKAAPSSVKDIKVCGFLISGFQLTAYIMDCPNGGACRLTKVGPHDFPRAPEQFSVKIIPLISLIWQIRTIIEATARIVMTDATMLMPAINRPQQSPIPPCMPSPKLVPRKRSLTDTDSM